MGRASWGYSKGLNNSKSTFFKRVSPIITVIFIVLFLSNLIDSLQDYSDLNKFKGKITSYDRTGFKNIRILKLSYDKGQTFKIPSSEEWFFDDIKEPIKNGWNNNEAAVVEIYYKKKWFFGTYNIVFQIKINDKIIYDLGHYTGKAHTLFVVFATLALIFLIITIIGNLVIHFGKKS
ncbi:MAG: hypothetical protein ABFS35_10315 [Bacteroidota bacterium]